MLASALERTHDLLHRQTLDGALFANPYSVTWLTGFAAPTHVGPGPFPGGPPLVWYAGGHFTLIIPEMWAAEVPASDAFSVATYPAYSYTAPLAGAAALQSLVQQCVGTARTVGVERQHLPAFLLPERAVLQPLDGLLEPLRAVKTEHEIALLRKNFALTDVGHAAVRQAMWRGAGLREIDLWQVVQSAIEQNAGCRVPLGNDLIVGPRPNNVGGWPGEWQVRAGDTVIVDLSTRLAGYWSDSCATYCAGEPTPRQKKVWLHVQQALELAISLVRPGAVASEIDQTVRRHITQAGYPDYAHHTGHGVGVSPHEEVRLTPYNPRTLEAGMVLMLEPGIYFPQEFGVRLEHAVLVTPEGAEVLTRHAIGWE